MDNIYRKISSTLIIIVLLSSSAWSKTAMIGFLSLTGARQAAMGQTSSLFQPDPFNLEYNPASIAGLKGGRIGFSHNSFIQGWNTNTLAAIFSAAGLDYGVHLRLSGIDEIEARAAASSDPDYLFDAQDFSFKVFAAKTITARLKAGVSVGWLMEKIDIHRGSGIVFGLGAVYAVTPEASLHASASNLGSKFSFKSEENDMPSIYRVGGSYRKYGLTLSSDYVNIKAGDGHLHLGGEYPVHEYFILRMGYQTGYDSRSFSAGAGFIYKFIIIDYAYVSYNSFKPDFGESHRFTLTIVPG